jgi:hypothetical protein
MYVLMWSLVFMDCCDVGITESNINAYSSTVCPNYHPQLVCICQRQISLSKKILQQILCMVTLQYNLVTKHFLVFLFSLVTPLSVTLEVPSRKHSISIGGQAQKGMGLKNKACVLIIFHEVC